LFCLWIEIAYFQRKIGDFDCDIWQHDLAISPKITTLTIPSDFILQALGSFEEIQATVNAEWTRGVLNSVWWVRLVDSSMYQSHPQTEPIYLFEQLTETEQIVCEQKHWGYPSGPLCPNYFACPALYAGSAHTIKENLK